MNYFIVDFSFLPFSFIFIVLLLLLQVNNSFLYSILHTWLYCKLTAAALILFLFDYTSTIFLSFLFKIYLHKHTQNVSWSWSTAVMLMMKMYFCNTEIISSAIFTFKKFSFFIHIFLDVILFLGLLRNCVPSEFKLNFWCTFPNLYNVYFVFFYKFFYDFTSHYLLKSIFTTISLRIFHFSS